MSMDAHTERAAGAALEGLVNTTDIEAAVLVVVGRHDPQIGGHQISMLVKNLSLDNATDLLRHSIGNVVEHYPMQFPKGPPDARA